jgi:hypothetical protein
LGYQETAKYDPLLAVWRVFLETRDFFGLKQQLLGNGVPFTVQQPDFFKVDVETTLQQLIRHYDPN